jgi:hypothetical protein
MEKDYLLKRAAPVLERRRFRGGCERRGCRPYLQGGRVRSKAMDVDIDLPASLRSNANARVCRDARGCDGSIRQELAARVRRATINRAVGTPRRAFLSPDPKVIFATGGERDSRYSFDGDRAGHGNSGYDRPNDGG